MKNLEESRLLIVDDDGDLLRQLEFLLEDDFKEIFTASSKTQALEIINSQPGIKIYLVDVRLSENNELNIDGLELVKEIRAKEADCPPVIIMMSRYNARKYETLAKQEAKADGFIRKPFTMEDFLDLVKEIRYDEK